MSAYRDLLNSLITRVNAHKARHYGSGADPLALSDLGVPTSAIDFNSQNITNTGAITAASPIWWHEYLIPPYSADPGASGATWVDPTTNRIGGWQLNHVDEHLHIHFHIEDDWDGATDPEFHLTFEINSAGSSGGDTVDIKVVFYYKALGAAVTKTQTVEVATVVNADAQYTQYHTEFVIDHDLVDNLVMADDTFGVTLNLETDTSEVDDITINGFEFKYKTAKVHMEV